MDDIKKLVEENLKKLIESDEVKKFFSHSTDHRAIFISGTIIAPSMAPYGDSFQVKLERPK